MVWMLRWYLWRRWLTPAEIRDLVYAGMKRGPAQIMRNWSSRPLVFHPRWRRRNERPRGSGSGGKSR